MESNDSPEILDRGETSLLDAIGALLNKADEKQVFALALLDLSAAFDTLGDSILSHRLETFGMCHMELEWFNLHISGKYFSLWL